LQKNEFYAQPPVSAGDGGYMLRVPLEAPGPIRLVTYTCEGRGCGWTRECPAGCPAPYDRRVRVSGNWAEWWGWSNSGAPAELHFGVYYEPPKKSQEQARP
jgi:hypothetical protein